MAARWRWGSAVFRGDRAAAYPFIEEGNEAVAFGFSRGHVLNHPGISTKQKQEAVQRLRRMPRLPRQLESHVQLICILHLH